MYGIKLQNCILASILLEKNSLTVCFLIPSRQVIKVGCNLEKGQYGPACDMWSCGVLLYVLLSRGSLPFDSEKGNSEIFSKILSAKVSLEGKQWEERSPEAIDLVRRLLTRKPKDRITAKEALAHPFVSEK